MVAFINFYYFINELMFISDLHSLMIVVTVSEFFSVTNYYVFIYKLLMPVIRLLYLFCGN